ncbi:MAG: hypothetical protein SGI92_04595, partial [Bryobacteraceae bacterium]|nr:hypothetical protein [Bryobacteraceae bacterium]
PPGRARHHELQFAMPKAGLWNGIPESLCCAGPVWSGVSKPGSVPELPKGAGFFGRGMVFGLPPRSGW